MGKSDQNDLLYDLESSTENIGRLYPVLVDFHGNIIDGHHRLNVDKKWPKIRLNSIKTKKDMIIAKLISNVCRRIVPAQEKRKLLNELGEILIKEGVTLGEITKQLSKDTGMSYTWVLKYLGKRYKDDLQSKRASRGVSATHRVARIKLHKLVRPPRRKYISISRYSNTEHTIYTVMDRFHERIASIAKMLETTPDIFIQNIIEEKLKEIRFGAVSMEDVKKGRLLTIRSRSPLKVEIDRETKIGKARSSCDERGRSIIEMQKMATTQPLEPEIIPFQYLP